MSYKYSEYTISLKFILSLKLLFSIVLSGVQEFKSATYFIWEILTLAEFTLLWIRQIVFLESVLRWISYCVVEPTTCGQQSTNPPDGITRKNHHGFLSTVPRTAKEEENFIIFLKNNENTWSWLTRNFSRILRISWLTKSLPSRSPHFLPRMNISLLLKQFI